MVSRGVITEGSKEEKIRNLLGKRRGSEEASESDICLSASFLGFGCPLFKSMTYLRIYVQYITIPRRLIPMPIPSPPFPSLTKHRTSLIPLIIAAEIRVFPPIPSYPFLSSPLTPTPLSSLPVPIPLSHPFPSSFP